MKKITLLFLLFSSICTFSQVVIVQNFDGSTSFPTGWTETGGKIISPTESCEGNSVIDNLYSSSTTGTLVAPNQVAASNGTDLTVSFDYKIENWNSTTAASPGWGNIQVQYSTDNGTAWTTFFTINDSNHVVANTCATMTSTVPAASLPTGSDVRIRYLFTWVAGDYDIYIDNFSALQVITSPPDCPSNLTADADANCGEYDVPITWDASPGSFGYSITIGTTPGGNEIVDDLDLGNATSYTLTGTSLSTDYYYTVIAYNGVGDSTGCSEMSFTTGANQCHCDPSSTNTNTTTLINDFVTTGGDTNISNLASGLSPGHYGNFYDTQFVSTYASGQFDFSATIQSGTVGCAIWIDWNSDFVYDPATETVFNTTSYSNGPFTGTITVPATVANGDYYMRVMIDYNDSNPDDDACMLAFGRGEIEDYKVTIGDAPACLPPTELTATTTLPDSAILSWTENGSAALWNIELVDITAGGAFTGTATATGVTNPYNQQGLTPENDYEFYVQADCDTDGTSAWAGPFAFSTGCAAIVAPYTEDFETFTVSSSAWNEQNCWTATNIGGYLWEVAATTDTSSGGTGPGSGISDGNYLFTEATSGSTGDAIDLISPFIDLSSLTAPSMSFDYHMFGGDMGTLEVIVNFGGTETTVFTLTGQQQTAESDPFITQIINLDAYAGEIIKVTFRGTKGADFESDMAIDSVVFDEAPSCFAPSNLTASNFTISSAELGWTENGSADTWDIEWGASGFTPTGTPNVNDTMDNPYTLSGLSEGTDYEFYVRADCGSDNTDVSTWSGPFSFTTAFTAPDCATNPVPADGAVDVAIGNFTLSWTAPATGPTPTEYNVYVYDDATGTNPTLILTTDTTSADVTVDVFGVEVFWAAISVNGTAEATGCAIWSFTIEDTPPPPSNNDCAGAIALTPGSTFETNPLVGTINGANGSGALPLPGCASYDPTDTSGFGGDVWYEVVVPADGNLTIETNANPTGTGGDSGMAVYTGTCGALSLFECDDDDSPDGNYSLVLIENSDGLAGQTVYVRVWEYAGDDPLTFQISAHSSTLGFGESLDVNQFTYYPNPVKNVLTLKSQSNIQNVSIYNMLGQEVVRTAPNTMVSEISMNDLQTGAYFVKVTINGATETIRVIKQ